MKSKRCKQELPGAPADLQGPGRELWLKLTSSYAIDDEHGRAVLAIACRAQDRAEAARQSIEKDGMTVRDKWNQIKPHPLLSVERDARAASLAAIRQLALPLEVK